jgi:hypothetical protein
VGIVVRGLVRHLRSNAIAYAALFFALGAGAYAVTKAPKNSVVSKSIKNGQVKAADVGSGQIGSAAIGNGEVRSEDVANGEIGAQDLANEAVDSGALADGAVGAQHLAPGVVAAADGVVNSQRVVLDDPADGGPVTRATLIQSGPFTFEGVCHDDGAGQVDLTGAITSTVSAHALEAVGADLLTPNTPRDLDGTNDATGADNAVAGPSVYAVAADGRFLSVSTQAVSNPTSGGDCSFHASGLAGP